MSRKFRSSHLVQHLLMPQRLLLCVLPRATGRVVPLLRLLLWRPCAGGRQHHLRLPVTGAHPLVQAPEAARGRQVPRQQHVRPDLAPLGLYQLLRLHVIDITAQKQRLWTIACHSSA
jgi:hypothetical protein